MYLPQDLASTIKEIMQNKNIKAKDMLEACELSINTLSNLNHNKAISFDSLAKIADYLNVSVDYLLGRTEHMNCSGNIDSIITHGSDNVINNNSNNITQSAPIENDDVWATYSKLSTKDKLEVQLDILNRGHK